LLRGLQEAAEGARDLGDGVAVSEVERHGVTRPGDELCVLGLGGTYGEAREGEEHPQAVPIGGSLGSVLDEVEHVVVTGGDRFRDELRETCVGAIREEDEVDAPGGPLSIHAVSIVWAVSKRGFIPRIAVDRLRIGDDERDAALSIRHVDAVETCLLRDGETERFLGERYELFVAVPSILDEIAARLGRTVGVCDLPRLQLAVELLEWCRRRSEVHVVLHRRLLTILGRDLRSDEERVPE
jgi:hypothetical protein